MGSLQAALMSAANTMRVLQRAVTVVENNVTNVGTPGFAKQQLQLSANGFDSLQQLPGGVVASGVQDYRDRYIEQVVWNQSEAWGYSDQRTSDLTAIESVFDIREDAGISSALSQFLQSFSSLSASPNDVSARQVVLDSAERLAGDFQLAARGLDQAQASSESQLRDVVDRINGIGEQLYDLNVQRQQDFSSSGNTAINSKMYSLIEELSELTDVSVLYQEDGGVGIYIGGESMFVAGQQYRPLQLDTSGDTSAILDVAGKDITDQFHSGRVKALLDFQNTDLPDYENKLNVLAQSVADKVNQTLANGVDQDGTAPVTDLFTYDVTVGAARTLAVSDLAPSEIAAALPSAPGGNGNALELAALGSQPGVGDFTFAEYYGSIAATLGRELDSAATDADVQLQILNQSKSWRQDVSGVDLDEEAVRLSELQSAYQATARLLSVLNEMTGVVLEIL